MNKKALTKEDIAALEKIINEQAEEVRRNVVYNTKINLGYSEEEALRAGDRIAKEIAQHSRDAAGLNRKKTSR